MLSNRGVIGEHRQGNKAGEIPELVEKAEVGALVELFGGVCQEEHSDRSENLGWDAEEIGFEGREAEAAEGEGEVLFWRADRDGE